MKIVIAPDKFKYAADAPTVAQAIADGVRDVLPDAELLVFPMADGGEGSGAILAAACDAQPREARVGDALGRPSDARWWQTPDGSHAIIEVAEVCGLARLAAHERNPLRTSSIGVGQLIAHAAKAGCGLVTLCAGGSATVDGGAGLLQGLGVRLLDGKGNEITEAMTGGALGGVRGVAALNSASYAAIELLVDVDNPLLGPRGAARVYGPQKGADAPAVETLEANLTGWAGVLTEWSGRDVRELAGGGAAGGLPVALHALLGTESAPGPVAIAWNTGVADALRGADLCITGEGKVDEQTLHGKVVSAISRFARMWDVPVVALCGAAEPAEGTLDELRAQLGLAALVPITPPAAAPDVALRETCENLRHAAEEFVRRWASNRGRQ